MNERHIIAVDLGSEKIAVCGAKVVDDNISIEYFDGDTPSSCMIRSSIINEGNAVRNLRAAIEKAKTALGGEVAQIVTNLPDFPIRMKTGSSESHLDAEMNITAKDLDDLRVFAEDNNQPEDPKEDELYGTSALSFSTDDSMHLSAEDTIGMCTEKLKGDFLIFTGKKTPSKRIDTVANKLNVAVMRKYFTPLVISDVVLEKQEKRSGVALIDFGASVVSVSIFLGGVLRYYGAVPFGGHTITGDISRECDIPMALAENIKKAYGYCNPSKLQNMQDKMIMISGNSVTGDHQIYVKYLARIIEARMTEIVNAVLYEIQRSGFAEQLKAGLVITGGGAEMCGCVSMFEDCSGYQVRKGNPIGICAVEPQAESIRDRSDSTAVLAMAVAAAKDRANLNCISREENNWERLRKSGMFENDVVSPEFKFVETQENEDREREINQKKSEEKTSRKKGGFFKKDSDGPGLFGNFFGSENDDETV